MTNRIEFLEARFLLSFDPTAREQESLELLNRMRQDPADELPLLINSNDDDVNSAISFFHVNKTVLQQQWDALTPAQPLAWNELLYNTARVHSQKMLDFDEQSHQLPGELDLGDRITAVGYDFSSVAENVFASAKSPFHTHAGFAIDWGNATNGIQNPPGHRNNIMNGDLREAGIGILDTTAGKSLGPQFITQDFGNRSDIGNAFLLGVVYDDANSNDTYTRGEGIAGAVIHIEGTGGTFDTTSMTAGGYQIQIPAGTYNITASGGGLNAPIAINNVSVGSQNVKEDFVEGATPAGPHTLTFDKNNKATYTDATGDTVTVTLKGAGTGTISLDSDQSDATAIVLDGTTIGSKLKIKSIGTTTIGNVTVHGALKEFVASNTDLAGNMTFDDSVKTLQLNNLASGGTLTTSGASLKLAAKFASISNAGFSIAGTISSFKANEWLDTDLTINTLSAAKVDTLQVSGDFDADVSVTGTLASLKAGGAINGAHIAANVISKISARSIAGATFTAAQIGKITAKTISNSIFRADNKITQVTADSIDGSSLFAGVRSDLNTLPTTLADFTDAASTVSKVTTKAFSNSLISAAALGKFKLGTIQTVNNGTPFGTVANTIKSLKGKTSTQTVNLKNLDLPGDSISEGDAIIQLL